MLSPEQNELVTRTGAGTPMGEVMRRYWIPAALAWELPEPDCAPIRVKLLGEKLVAFRDTEGRIGLVDEFCAHRRASLFLGRNEQGGLRCVYHGWKYDTKGTCLDMPNEPAETNFKHAVRLKTYPTAEIGGLIWAYMGPAEKLPPLPKFEWTQVPENYRHLSKMWQECNWLQALEGAIDNAHAGFLHRALSDKTTRPGLRGYWENSQAPRLDVHLTDYGFMYTATRALPNRENYVRAYQYVMPFHQFFPSQIANSGSAEKLKKPTVRGHMFVPMDDENCMVYNWTYTFADQALTESDGEQLGRHIGSAPEELTADFRKLRNRDNDWLIDRQVQKTETYSGIEGITTQDHAIQESMGPIVDRSRERLGSTDKAIIAARKLLLEAAQTVRDGGNPPGIDTSYYSIRAVERVLPDGVDCIEALKADVNPAKGR
jgi:phthalate 4,5-dioxygenase